MLSLDHRVVKAIMDIRLRGALARAEIELLLRRMRKESQGWSSWQVCWLVRQLGRRLVASGRRLERYGLAQDLSLEQEPCTCSGA